MIGAKYFLSLQVFPFLLKAFPFLKFKTTVVIIFLFQVPSTMVSLGNPLLKKETSTQKRAIHQNVPFLT